MRLTTLLSIASLALIFAPAAAAKDRGLGMPPITLQSATLQSTALQSTKLRSNWLALAQDDEDPDEDLDDDDLGLGDDDDDDDEGGDDDLSDDGVAADAAAEVKAEGTTVGEDTGGATGFVFPTGFYVSSDLGGFIRFGGYGDSRDGGGCFRCVPKFYSNLQPFIGVNIGYDIIKNFGVEMTLGTGFIADAAPVGYAFFNGDTPPPGVIDSPENSAVTMLNFALTGSWYFLDRLAIQGKGFIGGAILSPDPNPANLNLVRGLTCEGGSWGSPSPSPDCGVPFASDFGIAFGMGIGLRYATLLTDVVLGFDINMYGVVSPNVATLHTGSVRLAPNVYLPPSFQFPFALPIIPAISFAPVIKYVF